VVAEHPEEAVELQVDRGRLDAVLVERLDRDPTLGQGVADAPVGEDHGAAP
jgi:hypothetical protein